MGMLLLAGGVNGQDSLSKAQTSASSGANVALKLAASRVYSALAGSVCWLAPLYYKESPEWRYYGKRVGSESQPFR